MSRRFKPAWQQTFSTPIQPTPPSFQNHRPIHSLPTPSSEHSNENLVHNRETVFSNTHNHFNSILPDTTPMPAGHTLMSIDPIANQSSDNSVHIDNPVSDQGSTALSIVSPSQKILFIGGGGSIGTAMIKGILKGKVNAKNVFVSGPRPASMEHLQIPNENKFIDNVQAVRSCDVVILCVKPNIARLILKELTKISINEIQRKLLISVVHGLRIAEIEALLPIIPTIRAIPNVTAVVRHSPTIVCFGKSLTMKHAVRAGEVFEPMGTVQYVSENRFAVGVAISGCFTSLIFSMVEIVVNIADVKGISRTTAIGLAAESLVGIAKLLEQKQTDPYVLRNKFESPGCVAIVGSMELEKQGLHVALHAAIEKMIERAKDNGEQ